MTTAADGRQVQAGWYPDPLGAPQLRWWDGHAWTSHTSDSRHTQTRTAEQQPTASRAPYAEPPESAAAEAAERRARHRAPAADDARGDRPAAQLHADAVPALPAGTSQLPELGWAGAALTLHSVQSTRVPMLIELGVAGHPAIRIDARHQAFSWELGLDWFPEHPTGVVVSVELVGAGTPPPFELPGESLDALLWKVGRAAFPERLAPWLEPDQCYRLTRWPNWTTLNPDTDQIRQTAMLSNAWLTIDALAAMSGRSHETTRSLINALSLMGTLAAATIEAQPQAGAARGRLAEGGLFQRLRERFGL
ncbi:DUF2510 domain-containing protein [Protaetiibacter larvae]|uniref:DUF2510 domain-containing protein n=1 Tax=Protaetiibacter larvae TaxID=2592654 RepID=UPI001FEAB59A|nr:DUF2510 domain-containing protein [Protaetiibacter larvae]